MRAESKTESHLGTWYIPYLADTSYLSESQYLHCNDVLQSAVTHSGRTNNLWVVSFQWRPPQHFSGPVRFRSEAQMEIFRGHDETSYFMAEKI